MMMMMMMTMDVPTSDSDSDYEIDSDFRLPSRTLISESKSNLICSDLRVPTSQLRCLLCEGGIARLRVRIGQVVQNRWGIVALRGGIARSADLWGRRRSVACEGANPTIAAELPSEGGRSHLPQVASSYHVPYEIMMVLIHPAKVDVESPTQFLVRGEASLNRSHDLLPCDAGMVLARPIGQPRNLILDISLLRINRCPYSLSEGKSQILPLSVLKNYNITHRSLQLCVGSMVIITCLVGGNNQCKL